jgi:hypothetical protein
MLSFRFILFFVLRGTHTPSFAHSAPMRAEDLFRCKDGKGDENGGPLRGCFPIVAPLSYISLRDPGCKMRINHSFFYSTRCWLKCSFLVLSCTDS